jgi:hypothetical protein
MKKKKKTTLEAARELLANQISFIPVKSGADRKPAIGNPTDFGKRPPTEEETERWFQDAKWKLAIVTGVVSLPTLGGLWVVDIDDSGTMFNWQSWIDQGVIPKTNRVTRTRRGKHFYFANGHDYPMPGSTVFSSQEFHLEIKGASFNFLIAPPSVRLWEDQRTGEIGTYVYEWESEGPWEEITVFPVERFLQILRERTTPEQRPTSSLASPIGSNNAPALTTQEQPFFDPAPTGERNVRLTRDVGKLVGRLENDLVLKLAHVINGSYEEPLPYGDVETIVESVIRTHARNHPPVPEKKKKRKNA